MRNFVLGFILAALLTGGGAWLLLRNPSLPPAMLTRPAQKYHCPMHVAFVSDKPGNCPICDMRLVPAESVDIKDAHSEHQPGQSPNPKQRRVLYYVDPMNPNSKSDKPGKAPDGMDLVPVYSDQTATEDTAGVAGYAPIKISRDRQQMMGVTVEEARLMNLEDSIRTVGRVVADETRLHHVHTKFEGFIEELFVDYVGKFVRSGQPLFSIYSPELVATQKEYLLALRAQDQFGPSASGPALAGIDLLGSARQRLSLWDISADQIAELERTGRPIKALRIYSPVSGFVTAKTALQGMRVMPSDNLYDIIDLSWVWVLADVYEVNLPFVKLGQPAEMTLAYQPGRFWSGHVTYIYPSVDEKTRTLKVRLEFANPRGALKPEMYTNVELKGNLGKTLAVPESAVLSTGERALVFVVKDGGMFEPREVITGVKIRNFFEIKGGLAPGERVATGANFLLDSESKLKAAIAGVPGDHQHRQ
jgi:multidrug efflux pump subunit AcrA (membrane-fusion protein)